MGVKRRTTIRICLNVRSNTLQIVHFRRSPSAKRVADTQTRALSTMGYRDMWPPGKETGLNRFLEESAPCKVTQKIGNISFWV